jgi:translation initiation factor 2 subunit 2
MANYEQMLEKLYKEVKPIEKGERFEIPKVKGHVEGTKTIITNFSQICDVIRRDKVHVAKYLFKELATPGIIDGERLILNRKLNSAFINEKVESYVNEFVICPECKKPDSELKKEDRVMFLHCLACGAKHAVRTKI